jgi:DHA2 family multidrug resistance protein
MRSDFYLGIDFTHVALVQLIQGLGVALFFMPVLSILLSDLQQNEIAAGSGLATFLRTLGGSFAASITTFLWEHRAVVHHAQLAERINPYNPVAAGAIEQLGGGNDQLAESITPYNPIAQASLQQLGHGDTQLGGSVINGMITQQGYQISFNEVFHMLGWIFLALVAVIWLAKPPFAAKAGPSSGGH